MIEKMKYREGVLSIDLDHLLDAMGDEDKVDLVQRLSCDDAVIKHVSDQIIHGCTDDGSHGSVSCQAGALPSTALDVARREVAKAGSEMARQEIGKLEQALASEEERCREMAAEISAINRSRY